MSSINPRALTVDSDRDQQKIYSAGDCPVCADSGAVLLLKAHGSAAMLFFCPLCGVAWREAPFRRRLDTVSSLTDLAPSGAALPTVEEAVSTGLALTEVSFDVWYPLLKARLT